jgi:hypothetical protein
MWGVLVFVVHELREDIDSEVEKHEQRMSPGKSMVDAALESEELVTGGRD